MANRLLSIQGQDMDRRLPHGLELRHLRYFIAVADAGTFTHAAQRIFIAQPTLSQQIRRLEEMVGTPLLNRRRDGIQLTSAGTVLLQEARAVLALLDHGVSRTRQAGGQGRLSLRVVLPPSLPDALAVPAASRLRAAAAAVGVDVVWLEAPLDADFSLIDQRAADAGLGWLPSPREAAPKSLDMMSLGEFEPEVWVSSAHPSACRGTISLKELAGMDVIHDPRQRGAAVHDAWHAALRAVNPSFEFVEPPIRSSLPITVAFAAAAGRPSAVLTPPRHLVGSALESASASRPYEICGMVALTLDQCPLTATAVLVWTGDLPRQLQQLLFETAEGIRFDDASQTYCETRQNRAAALTA